MSGPELPRGMIRIAKRGEVLGYLSPTGQTTTRASENVPDQEIPQEKEESRRGVLRINASDLSTDSDRSAKPLRYSRPAFNINRRPSRGREAVLSPSRFRLSATNSSFRGDSKPSATSTTTSMIVRPSDTRTLGAFQRPIVRSLATPEVRAAPVFAADFATQEIFKALEQAKPTSIPKPPIPELTEEQKNDPDALREFYLIQFRMILKDTQSLRDFTMTRPVKLIDSYFFWCLHKGQPLDNLIAAVDPFNKNFNVVGVLGLQETGKSFILSQIVKAGSDKENQDLVFNSNADAKVGRFRTEGIDCFISRPQRTIFLDAQPVYSGSVLEEMIIGDRKPPAISTEHVFVEHTAELQSILFSAFVLSVCHKVIIVSKGFYDERLLRFLRLATILKLGPVHKDSLVESNLCDHWPELVFVNNMCSREHLYPERIMLAKQKIYALLKDYPFHYNSDLAQNHLFDNISSAKPEEGVFADVNCFAIPDLAMAAQDDCLNVQYHYQMKLLREKVCGTLPEDSVTPGIVMSEKDWFKFTKRCWAAVCKAPLVNTVAKELNVSNSA